jgi:hypothetical protein
VRKRAVKIAFQVFEELLKDRIFQLSLTRNFAAVTSLAREKCLQQYAKWALLLRGLR